MSSPRATRGLFVAAGLIIVAALLMGVGREVRPQKLAQPLGKLPLALGSWRAVGPDQTLDQSTLKVLRPSDYLLRNYINPQGEVCAVFVALFRLAARGADHPLPPPLPAGQRLADISTRKGEGPRPR